MNQITDLRTALDERVLDLARLQKSRETSLALTTLQQGRMLLGAVLKEFGNATPYPQADNPLSPEVAPAANVARVAYDPQLPENDIAAVKTVRSRLAGSITLVECLRPEIAQACRDTLGDLALVSLDAARTELVLSKNWLGMELSRLALAAEKI